MGPQKAHMPLPLSSRPPPYHSFHSWSDHSYPTRQHRRCSQRTGGKGCGGEAAVATWHRERRSTSRGVSHPEDSCAYWTGSIPSKQRQPRCCRRGIGEASDAAVTTCAYATRCNWRGSRCRACSKGRRNPCPESQLDVSTKKAQVDKHKEEPKKKAVTFMMSTEAADVQVGSATYWVDANAKKKKTTNVVVKVPKPKPDSRTDLHWPGYCVEGCDVCVAKREEPSKTTMLNLKRVSKKPST